MAMTGDAECAVTAERSSRWWPRMTPPPRRDACSHTPRDMQPSNFAARPRCGTATGHERAGESGRQAGSTCRQRHHRHRPTTQTRPRADALTHRCRINITRGRDRRTVQTASDNAHARSGSPRTRPPRRHGDGRGAHLSPPQLEVVERSGSGARNRRQRSHAARRAQRAARRQHREHFRRFTGGAAAADCASLTDGTGTRPRCWGASCCLTSRLRTL